MIKKKVVLYAPAKINLSLNVVGKKDNGYHLISSHVIFVDLKDYIVLRKSNENNLFLSGPTSNAIQLDAKENLASKALVLIQELGFTKDCYSIYLNKKIPVAAGLGGGSADAAAIIRYFFNKNCIYELNKKAKLLLKIGADVPSCYYSSPMHISGVGENIKLIRNVNKTNSMPNMGIIMVNSKVFVSTEDVFSKFKFDSILINEKNYSKVSNISNIVGGLTALKYGNDLLKVTKELYPQIDETLKTLQNLQNCKGVGMSGSGPTCFALFKDINSAKISYKTLNSYRLFENYWTWCGGLYNQINNL